MKRRIVAALGICAAVIGIFIGSVISMDANHDVKASMYCAEYGPYEDYQSSTDGF